MRRLRLRVIHVAALVLFYVLWRKMQRSSEAIRVLREASAKRGHYEFAGNQQLELVWPTGIICLERFDTDSGTNIGRSLSLLEFHYYSKKKANLTRESARVALFGGVVLSGGVVHFFGRWVSSSGYKSDGSNPLCMYMYLVFSLGHSTHSVAGCSNTQPGNFLNHFSKSTKAVFVFKISTANSDSALSIVYYAKFIGSHKHLIRGRS